VRSLYVKELFALLRTLGVEQQRVVTTLGVSKTQVSLWANGHQPLPRKRLTAFQHFVEDAIAEQRAAVLAQHPPSPRTFTLLKDRTPIEGFEEAVLKQLHRWDLECYAASGELAALHKRYREEARRFLHLDLTKLSADELSCYIEALRGQYRTARIYAHVLELTDLSEGRYLTPPLSPFMTPEAYLGDIIARYTGREESTDREEEEE
jgi:hypothetical protein